MLDLNIAACHCACKAEKFSPGIMFWLLAQDVRMLVASVDHLGTIAI